MNETDYGYIWDVSWEGDDVIIIDLGEETITLTKGDLKAMLETL